MSDRHIPVRRQAVRRRDPRLVAGRSRWRPDLAATLIGLTVIALLIGTPLLVLGALTPSNPSPSPSGSPAVIAASEAPPSASPASAAPSGSAGPAASAAASATARPTVPVAFVPVVGFWSTARAISEEELRNALRGRSEEYRQVIVPQADRRLLERTLGIDFGGRVRTGTPGQVRAGVRRGGLGLLRAGDVTPAVRALSIERRSLFGTQRITQLSQWPLVAEVPETDTRGRYDPGDAWTIAAAGDILLDRGVARQVKVLGKGVDFPFDGGNAEITGYTCCSGFGHRVPAYRRTGNEGGMRRLLTEADLALANLESPVDDEFVYHTEGTTFSGDPALLRGLDRGGFDFLSLGNNHIGDAGDDGIDDTIAALDERGIAYSGAGETETWARRPAMLEANGVRVAILGCDAVAQYYWAQGEDHGSASCETGDVVRSIRAAKRRADLVVVYPHWGVEYDATPSDVQRDQASEWIEAGADMIIGNHAHWAAAVEEIEGKLVFYALGNFVFDQMWSEQTMEGLVLELTFEGETLRQAWLHPIIIIDQAQPNFMDPAGDGQNVLDQVQEASEGLLPY